MAGGACSFSYFRYVAAAITQYCPDSYRCVRNYSKDTTSIKSLVRPFCFKLSSSQHMTLRHRL